VAKLSLRAEHQPSPPYGHNLAMPTDS